jgi:hypothetical protein
MGHQIVKQPNGKYAIWSTVVEDFVCIDCENQQELVDEFMDYERRRTEANVARIVSDLDAGRNPYLQFTMSFRECVGTIEQTHGPKCESLKMLRTSLGDEEFDDGEWRRG